MKPAFLPNFSIPFGEYFFESSVQIISSFSNLKDLPVAVISTSASKSDLYLLKDRHDPIETYYYVCENNLCKIPVQSIDELFSLLDSKVEDLIYNPNFFFK